MKKENGSATLFVLSAILLIISILVILYILFIQGNNNQEKQIEKIQKEYNSKNESLEEAYNNSLKENEIQETEEQIKPYGKGDINYDGQVNQDDLDLMMQHVNKRITLEGEQFKRADINDDDDVNTGDLTLLSLYINNKNNNN